MNFRKELIKSLEENINDLHEQIRRKRDFIKFLEESVTFPEEKKD